MKIGTEELLMIFHAYSRSQFTYNGSTGTVRQMAGINRRYMVEEEAPTGDTYRIDKCQLLLKKLEDISDSDCIEVAKICGTPSADRLGWGKEFILYWIDSIVDDLKVSNKEMVAIIDYLRK
jgi:hypothetical protein